MPKITKNRLFEAGGDAHIDVAYGMFDRPAPQIGTEQLPDFKPVIPKDQVANQLSLNRPPVDNADYAPDSMRDLKLAISALAEKIPAEEIENFYKHVRRLVSELSLEKIEEIARKTKGKEPMKNNMRKKLSRVVEAPVVRKKGGAMAPASVRTIDPADLAADEEEAAEAEADVQDDKRVLQRMADRFGYAGPSGAAGATSRGAARAFKRFEIPAEAREKLQGFAYDKYISSLKDMGAVDNDEYAYLMTPDAKSHVMYDLDEMPSFRFFYDTAVQKPALDAIEERFRNKFIAPFLDKVGVPEKVKTVYADQILRWAEKDMNEIGDLLNQDAKSTGESPRTTETKLRRLTLQFPTLQEYFGEYVKNNILPAATAVFGKTKDSKIERTISNAANDPEVMQVLNISDEE